MQERVLYYSTQPKESISERISELDHEWDLERWLEANAATAAFAGLVLGLAGRRTWFLLPAAVLPFLFMHALKGWCPPVPVLRRLGVRTQREIDAEKYSLKALRGDFAELQTVYENTAKAIEAFKACQT